MTWITSRARGFLAFLAAALLVAPVPALGQAAVKRLSDWLLEQPASPDAYPLGLSWQVPEETVSQTASYVDLLNRLSGSDRAVPVAAESLARVRNLVRTLPVTGRVPVAVPDARWLQANPARDPILRSDHRVILPRRPQTVTVVTENGERCAVPHRPDSEALAYLSKCMPSMAAQVDWIWVAQPDGRVQRYGAASWNQEEQDLPAPGAWIWGPSRGSGWPELVSQQLVGFLATQGPAPDPQSAATSLRLADSSRPPAPSAPRSSGLEVTANDFGEIGLMQTPTARMAKAGHFAFHLSHERPYTHGNTFLQPFDWLEVGFRYTDIGNRPYGPPELSGTQTYKDKGIDAKFRLWRESAFVPEVAVGLRDIAGTGFFSGEYVVGNKRTGNFDWSLGLGWGYLGARGDVRNPLSRLSRSFESRNTNYGQGGNLGFGSYFRGPAAFFGGVQYQSPWKPLLLKLEYDGNDYQREALLNNQVQRTPFNFGLVYRAARWLDLSFGIERGNTAMLGLTFHTQLDSLETPKATDPPRVPVVTTRPAQPPDWSTTSRDIATQTEWEVDKIDQRGNELRVVIDNPQATYWRDRIDKAAAVLNRDAPASVDRIALSYRRRGQDMVETVIDRDAWVEERTQPLPPHEKRESVITRPVAARGPAEPPATLHYLRERRTFESGLGFDYQQTLGGPDGFVLFQISAVERVKWNLRNDTWVQGTVRLGLIDNYDKFKYTAPSNLPRVRTFLREYLTTSPLTLPNLQATHVGKLSENQFYSVYGGFLESMFAGVGAEWLYRRAGSRVAFGIDGNYVRQRNFAQDFGFRDYRVATGHATLYWDTGWQDIQAKVSVGRYLAKDFGATLDLSRVFKNGVTVGAFATKTNVSAAQFGEGSFDKGIYVSIPFDALLTRSTNSVGTFVWKPLTRDGGAMLARANALYDLTDVRSERTMWYEPAPRANEYLMPADRRDEWKPIVAMPQPTLQSLPRPAAEKWAPGSNYEHRLVEELHRQGFRDIRVAFDATNRLALALSNETIRPASRAVGRAARSALALAPLEAREIRITMVERDRPLVAYTFADLRRLEGYFKGTTTVSELAPTIGVSQFDPGALEQDPIALLGDIDTRDTPRKLREIVPGYPSAERVGRDIAAAGRTSAGINWWKAGLVGTGLVVASSALDKRGLRFAQDHANSQWLKTFNTVGNVLPWIGAGMVTLAALDDSDPRRSATGMASLESAGVAFLASTGLKYLTGRARPAAGLGSRSFKPLSSQDSFPSRHAILAWAVATPFALEYDSNWRYGAAAIASIARITRREHWVSDVVAGSLLGYGIGHVFWESSREQRKGSPRAMLSPNGVSLQWELD